MGTNCSTCNCNKDEKEIEIVTNDSTKKSNVGKGKGATLELGKVENSDKPQTATLQKSAVEEHVEKGADGDESSDGDLEYKEEHRFQNGAIYKGGWKNEKRHGEGVQIWPDGARYEGHWRKNKAHGKGKFWHVDGDTDNFEISTYLFNNIFLILYLIYLNKIILIFCLTYL